MAKTKKCEICLKNYTTHNIHQRFCSQSCRDEYNTDENGFWNGKGLVPKGLRFDVLRRDEFQCVYCGSRSRLEIDHLIPKAEGGGHRMNNLVTACRACNKGKADKLLSDTELAIIKARIF